MGIFSKIKDAIFGHKPDAAPTPAPTAAPAQHPAPTAAPAAPTPAAPAAAPAQQPVDIEQVLSDMQSSSGRDLNWRSSIVDLMKLVGMESSLSERKELAQELGYTISEQNLPREMIYLADEVFMTGTAAEITPIRSVDRKKIGSGEPGPTTRAIQQQFFGLFEGKVEDKHG